LTAHSLSHQLDSIEQIAEEKKQELFSQKSSTSKKILVSSSCLLSVPLLLEMQNQKQILPFAT